jgi:hypothetical protein
MEIEKYALDDRGNIPKKYDHLIDCFRYFLSSCNYSMHEVLEAVRYKSDKEAIRRGRLRHPGDDELFISEDWMGGVFDIDLD